MFFKFFFVLFSATWDQRNPGAAADEAKKSWRKGRGRVGEMAAISPRFSL